MKLDYAAWRVRHVDPNSRRYSVAEHAVYVALSMLVLAVIVRGPLL